MEQWRFLSNLLQEVQKVLTLGVLPEVNFIKFTGGPE
jgi:hypothetical protein